MQLKNTRGGSADASLLKSKIARRRLIAASCALLGTTAARSQDAGGAAADSAGSAWGVDSALAYYHESGRITAIEPIVNVAKDYGDGKTFSAQFIFDSLSGSTPNGALPSTKAQTFASPSGKSLSAAPTTYTSSSGQLVSQSAPIYTIEPGQLPMDPHYHDQRLALSGDWGLPLTRLLTASAGGKLSYESDFLSVSANAGIARDFNEKNTTLSFQLNDEFDSLRPIGGAPVAGSDYALFQKGGGKSKDGVGAMLGLTQVLSRRWLTELNLSVDRFKGYLNDPYKIISIIDGAGNTTGYLYEKRPDTRTRKSLYWENRTAWGRVSAALSLRYMTDTWRVRSDTAQIHVRWWNFDRDRYLEPTVRWYRQSAADFYTPWLDSAGARISYASSDARLGAFQAVTYGLKYGAKLDDADLQSSSQFSLRLEYYQQTPDHRQSAPGALQGLDLYPGLKAILLQVGWKF
ncbi:MAG TPA: DUF3570 domain-containing protein [Steroidobacteraceae bacterium]|nr:DUF3570 domain-containing protein [Steroidobacteraceae bacterium]